MGYIYLKYILKETKHKFPDLSCYFQEAFQQENMNTEK